MNRTPYYFEDISQTALALLALVATEKSLDKAVAQSLRSLILNHDDFGENRVNFTVFSGCNDEDDDAELPVIIPFESQTNKLNSYHNGYGALALGNKKNSKNNLSALQETNSKLRIFSPDVPDYHNEEDAFCIASTTPALRIYAE